MKCEHEACVCEQPTVERNGEQFCSEECANDMGGVEGTQCRCTHSGCMSKRNLG